MATTRKTAPPSRKAAQAAAAPHIPEGFVLRLHATTALSRIMRGDHEGARELLTGLTVADVEAIARDAELLTATAWGVHADLTAGRSIPA
jgi:hypothetical protein